MRQSNPTRIVFFGGLKFMNPSWIIANPDSLVFPANDSHLALEVHSYDPYVFCGSNGAKPLVSTADQTVGALQAGGGGGHGVFCSADEGVESARLLLQSS